jgi:putative DNA primase/helicase
MANIAVTNDGSFTLAIGKHRRSKTWRNQTVEWSEFLGRIKETHRTAERYSEYMHESKTRQDEIKDVGGFVGGYVNRGLRRNGNILSRQLITLDIDFGTKTVWEDFTMLYDCAAAVYSTHKHCPDSPRLRLILPLDREVTTDEYVPIARRIAGSLDINLFDDTTYEPTRLMYWPSTAKDAEYIFHYQDGPWLSADKLLSTFRDWRDASEWPISDRTGELIHREIKKQEDPTEKPGIVGAWCRTYDIHEVIAEYLDGVYEPCDAEDRYTFIGGSTSAGLIIYDDKYAYSHHGTDPCSGKLCNAFDLVRIHMHGLKDEDAKADTPSNRMPSYTAMVEMATKDPRIRQTIATEKLHEAREDFAANMEGEEADETAEESDVDKYAWTKNLDVDGKGNIKSTIDNVVLILEHDPALKGRLAMNTFEHREVLRGNVPWRKVVVQENMVDSDDAGLRHYLESSYQIASAPKIKDALDIVVKRNSFNPVLDYLKKCEENWDGKERIDTLLIDYLACVDSVYIRTITRKTLVAAVRRVFHPGCKFDNVLVLVGNQGCGKSTLAKKLGRAWFSDTMIAVHGKDAYEQLQGKWIMELAELAGLKKAEINTVKHFISKQEDSFRVAYGRRLENFPRQCIFIGTINEADFLQDTTGNRRFWPADTGPKGSARLSIFDDLTDEEINQIWGEAVCRYKAGETLFLSKELEEEAIEQQTSHSELDERSGLVQAYLNTPITENWINLEIYERRNFFMDATRRDTGSKLRERVSVAEIWCELFGRKMDEMTKFNTHSVHGIMKTMAGWELSKAPIRLPFYGNQRVYRRVLDKNDTYRISENDPKYIQDFEKAGIEESIQERMRKEYGL